MSQNPVFSDGLVFHFKDLVFIITWKVLRGEQTPGSYGAVGRIRYESRYFSYAAAQSGDADRQGHSRDSAVRRWHCRVLILLFCCWVNRGSERLNPSRTKIPFRENSKFHAVSIVSCNLAMKTTKRFVESDQSRCVNARDRSRRRSSCDVVTAEFMVDVLKTLAGKRG